MFKLTDAIGRQVTLHCEEETKVRGRLLDVGYVYAFVELGARVEAIVKIRMDRIHSITFELTDVERVEIHIGGWEGIT